MASFKTPPMDQREATPPRAFPGPLSIPFAPKCYYDGTKPVCVTNAFRTTMGLAPEVVVPDCNLGVGPNQTHVLETQEFALDKLRERHEQISIEVDALKVAALESESDTTYPSGKEVAEWIKTFESNPNLRYAMLADEDDFIVDDDYIEDEADETEVEESDDEVMHDEDGPLKKGKAKA